MRIRRRLAEQHQRETARKSNLRESIKYVLRKLRLGHPHAKRFEDGTIRLERDLIGESHDLYFVRSLYPSASIRDCFGGRHLDRRRGVRHLVEHERARAPVDAELARRDTPLLEDACDECLGTLVLLPHPDLEPPIHLVSGAPLLESRRDDDALSRLRQDQGEETLASRPVHTREVHHVRARLDEHRGVAQLLHEPLGLLASLHSLGLGDGRRRVRPSRSERGQLGGKISLVLRRLSGVSLFRSEAEERGTSGEGRAALNEISAIHWSLLLELVTRKESN